MQPPDDFNPPIGVAETLQDGLRRVVAPNPSPMTYRGTNTYLVGHKDLAVIDPGPLSDTHLRAIKSAVQPGQRITHIVVTHSHLDHSPLARPLSAVTGAPVLAFGSASAGRSAVMQDLASKGLASGGEGIDADFVPDRLLCDGDVLVGGGWTLEVLHTPGHLSNHICLKWHDCCFTADHVMGWSTSLVSPPDGDLTDFMASCARLSEHKWDKFFPGHGDIVRSPNDRLAWLIAHRKLREREILDVLKSGPAPADEITRLIYADIPPQMLPAAQRNVIAHLIDLIEKSLVHQNRPFDLEAPFELTSDLSE